MVTWKAAGMGVLGLLLFSLELWAQSDPVLVQRLAEINEQAAAQARAGQHDEAARLFQASLLLQELDISYLNLGRSLALAGRCEEALDAYEQALHAPPCHDPSPEEIARVVARYRAELPEQCGATLTFDCEPGSEVAIDDGAWVACASARLLVEPGRRRLRARSAWGAELSYELSLVGLEQQQIVLHFGAAPTPEVQIVEHTRWFEAPATWSDPLLWGGISLGLGASCLLSALLVEVLMVNPVFERYQVAARTGDAATFEALRGPLDDLQPVNQGLVIGGSILTGIGTIIIVLALSGFFDEDLSEPVAWGLGDERGMGWSWRW